MKLEIFDQTFQRNEIECPNLSTNIRHNINYAKFIRKSLIRKSNLFFSKIIVTISKKKRLVIQETIESGAMCDNNSFLVKERKRRKLLSK